MIYFNDLTLNKEIIKALDELTINYVFQPIFRMDGKTIYAREALMRPTNMTVTELIEQYTKSDKLHILEIATFFWRDAGIPITRLHRVSMLEFFSFGMFYTGGNKSFC